MRKGFMLVELLASVLVLSVVLATLNPMIITLIQEVPRQMAMTASHDRLAGLAGRAANDIRQATVCLDRLGAWQGGPHCLILQGYDGVTVWRFDPESETVVRESYAGPGGDDPAPTGRSDWHIPKGRLEWNWRSDDGGMPVAVALQTWVEYKKGRHSHRKWATTHLFFLAGDYRPGRYRWQDRGNPVGVRLAFDSSFVPDRQAVPVSEGPDDPNDPNEVTGIGINFPVIPADLVRDPNTGGAP